MKNNWNVTFDTITPESVEEGDYESCGYELENVSLREALDVFGSRASEANEWPITGTVQWFDGDYEVIRSDDIYEQKKLSLHIPRQITSSSRLRLARYLGLKIGR